MLMIAIASIIAGATIVLGRNINSILANKIGLFEGTFFNYIVGLSFSLIFLVFSNDYLSFSTSILKAVPIWAFLGGFLGVIVVSISNLVTPKISAFYLTLILFIGQLFSGVIIDFFSQGLISMGKVIGGLLVILGLSYNLIIDKKLLKEKTC
ncbi:DMT family transporter [Candidatus Clostridium stratigraminis]|uniref:DMT family transporter n=1 Tax=Candidatus Clostridium stratigraminis TaxID=3381661 RepID=A0ABW8T514_9CLOT